MPTLQTSTSTANPYLWSGVWRSQSPPPPSPPPPPLAWYNGGGGPEVRSNPLDGCRFRTWTLEMATVTGIGGSCARILVAVVGFGPDLEITAPSGNSHRDWRCGTACSRKPLDSSYLKVSGCARSQQLPRPRRRK